MEQLFVLESSWIIPSCEEVEQRRQKQFKILAEYVFWKLTRIKSSDQAPVLREGVEV